MEKLFKKSSFIYFWLPWIFTALHGFPLAVVSRGYPSLFAQASPCSGFSCCRAQALGVLASVVAERRPSSYRTQAQLLYAMWDLPRPGIEPVSPTVVSYPLCHREGPEKNAFLHVPILAPDLPKRERSLSSLVKLVHLWKCQI